MNILLTTQDGFRLWSGDLFDLLESNPGEFNSAESLMSQLRNPGGKLLCGGGAAGVYFVEEVR